MAEPPLIVRGSRSGRGLLLLTMAIVGGGRIWLQDHGPGGALPWGEWLLISLFGAGGLLGAVYIVFPPKLTIDDEGATFEQIGYRKRINWSDVERIHVASRPRTDLVGRFRRSTSARLLYAARIGMDFKAGRNPIVDPVKAAYSR